MWHVVFAVCLRRRLMSDAGLMLGGRGFEEKMGPSLPPPPLYKEKKQDHQKNAKEKMQQQK